MHDHIEIVKLRARKLEEVSRKTSRGVVESGRKLCQCNGCRLIECSGRAATQDYLLGRVLRLVFLRQGTEANCLVRLSERWKCWWLAAPLIYFSTDSSEDASCISSMAGYSTSWCESGTVSKPSAGASLGTGSELSDVRPIGTRHKETSRRVSRSSRRFTSASTNPSTISAVSPEAVQTASIFASRVPLSQPKWR